MNKLQHICNIIALRVAAKKLIESLRADNSIKTYEKYTAPIKERYYAKVKI